MPKFSDGEVQDQLPAAPGWDRVGDMLVRAWQFPSARRALEFLNAAAAVAERADHHPDLVLSYRTVRIELLTHADGGLTASDFALANDLNALPTDR